MRVLCLTLGSELVASTRVRILQHIPHLANAGISVRVLYGEPAWRRRLRLSGSRKSVSRIVLWLDFSLLPRFDNYFRRLQIARLLRLAPAYDALILQKVVLKRHQVEQLKRCGKPIVFDVDDALLSRPERWSTDNSLVQQLKMVDEIVVANESLAEMFGRFGTRVTIVPTLIDTGRYFPAYVSADNRSIVVGWIGSPSTARYLSMLDDVFAQLKETFADRIRFVAVGARPNQLTSPLIDQRPWSLSEEVQQLQTFDIGIMPLHASDWESGKSGYKLLQYMACGIPSVASPVGLNATLVKHGKTGFLANDSAAWVSYLSQLIESAELRQQMGQNSRLFAEKEHSFQRWSPKLASVLIESTRTQQASLS